MKRHVRRSLIIATLNGFAAFWLIELLVDSDSVRQDNIALLSLLLFLVCGAAVLDWFRPNWACVLNMATWTFIAGTQIYGAAHARWAEEKVGAVYTVLITLFIGAVYLASWCKKRSVPA